jgi:hypothetical protein
MNPIIEGIIDQSVSYRTRVVRIEEIDLIGGQAKELFRRIVEVGETRFMLVHALRHAAKAPDQNQIELEDLGWFVPAAIGIAESVEINLLDFPGEEADYKRLSLILRDEKTRAAAIERLGLKEEKYGKYWGSVSAWLHTSTHANDIASRVSKLVVLFSGEAE